MSQEQIRVQAARRPRQQGEEAQGAAGEAARIADSTVQFTAIDDVINDILGPPPAADVAAAERERRTVRQTVNSEAFVNGFRQHGGQ